MTISNARPESAVAISSINCAALPASLCIGTQTENSGDWVNEDLRTLWVRLPLVENLQLRNLKTDDMTVS